MSAAPDALLAALADALKKDAALTALLPAGRIHETPPPGAAFPYITLGEGLWRTLPDRLIEHELRLQIWSRKSAAAEIRRLLAAALAALNAAAPPAGYALVSLAPRDSRITRLDDAKTWRAQIRLRAVTETLTTGAPKS